MQALSRLAFILALSASSCLSTRVARDAGNNEKADDLKEQLDFENATLQLLNEQKIDPAELWVKNLKVDTTVISKTPHGWVSFELDPRADHIETLDCAIDEEAKKAMPTCRTSTKLVENYLLAGLKPGIYSISVRPCVAIAKSKTKTSCGQYQKSIYQQNPSIEEEIAAKTAELDQINQTLIGMGKPLYEAMLIVQKSLPNCKDSQVNKLISKEVADKYVALGPAYIGAGLANPDARIILDADGNISVTFPAELEGTNNSDSNESGKGFVLGDGEQVAVDVILVGGGLVLAKKVGHSFIQFGVSYFWKSSKKAIKKTETYKNFMKKWGGRVAGVALLGGVITLTVFAIQDPQGTKEFLFGLTDGGPCTECARALADIVSIGRQAEELQKEMKVKQNELNLLLAPTRLK